MIHPCTPLTAPVALLPAPLPWVLPLLSLVTAGRLAAFRCSTSAPGVCYVGDDPWANDDSCWLDANFTFVARDR